MITHLWTALRRNLLAGVLVLLPAGISAWLVYTLWQAVNQPLDSLLTRFGFDPIPGAGLFVVLAGIYLVGLAARSLLGRSLISLGESIVHRVPLLGTLYGVLKQIIEMVLSDQSTAFREVVLIQYPRPGIWTLAFKTGTVSDVMAAEADKVIGNGAGQRTSGDEAGGSTPTGQGGEEPAADASAREKAEEKIYLFVPTTPNPTSGFLILVPARDAVPLDISIDDAIKLIISGGVVSPFRRASEAPPPPPLMPPFIPPLRRRKK